jgi:hypothetical protein
MLMTRRYATLDIEEEGDKKHLSLQAALNLWFLFWVRNALRTPNLVIDRRYGLFSAGCGNGGKPGHGMDFSLMDDVLL